MAENQTLVTERIRRIGNSKNIGDRLRLREIVSVPRLTRINPQVQFRNMSLQAEYDPIMGTSMVEDILLVEEILFVLGGGVCSAYNRGVLNINLILQNNFCGVTLFCVFAETHQRLCLLNTGEEAILSMDYNSFTDSIVTASDGASNDPRMNYRSTKIGDIRRGVNNGVPLFAPNSYRAVKFDDGNERVYARDDNTLTVFNMTTYEILFSKSVQNLREIISSHGRFSLWYVVNDELRVDIICAEDGRVVKSITRELLVRRNIKFTGLFEDKLLLKQQHAHLRIYNVLTDQELEVEEFVDPGVGIPLVGKKFITITDRFVDIWSTDGTRLRCRFDDHMLYYGNHAATTCLTRDQQCIISYCIDHRGGGTINISYLKNGWTLGKITSTETRIEGADITSTVAEALEGITCVVYDDEHNQIYTGNRDGMVHMWSD